MSTAPVDPVHASNAVAVHYSTVFKFGTPVLCESTALRTPATKEPRYVTCAECLARMTAAQQRQRGEHVRRYG
jgi:hypothetical protein